MKPFILLILDGWGHSKDNLGNAISNAQTPNLDLIASLYPNTLLQASGKAVGMSWGEPGNSEVGHLTIGAGRVVYQYLSRINEAIENGSFSSNSVLTESIDKAVVNNGTIHLAGLLTSGSVHAFFEHPIALAKLAKDRGAQKIRMHFFGDGKDSELTELYDLIENFKSRTTDLPITITTVVGRDLAMNRIGGWDKTEKTFNLINSGQGQSGTLETIKEYYSQNITDSYIPPLLLDPTYDGIKDGDTLIFWNFREDSMRQISKSFELDKEFTFFDRGPKKNINVVTMTPYGDKDSNLPFAFSIPEIKNGLAEVISNQGLKQLHLAEMEKYAHATYFFNCLKNEKFPNEDDILFEPIADTVANPEMRVYEITNKIIESIDSYDFIIANFANADLLAHLGNYEAAIQGVQAIDNAIGQIYKEVLSRNGTLVITSDHGNAESIMYKRTGKKETKHDENPVPIYLIREDLKNTKPFNPDEISGFLADVAPTVLKLLNIEKPQEMTGNSII